MSNSEIEEYLIGLDDDIKLFKEDLFKISWYMRGGVNINDLFHTYSHDDIDILHKIIKENIDVTIKTKMPLI